MPTASGKPGAQWSSSSVQAVLDGQVPASSVAVVTCRA